VLHLLFVDHSAPLIGISPARDHCELLTVIGAENLVAPPAALVAPPTRCRMAESSAPGSGDRSQTPDIEVGPSDHPGDLKFRDRQVSKAANNDVRIRDPGQRTRASYP
jgi:hypothetical protein